MYNVLIRGKHEGFDWDHNNVAHIARHSVTPDEVDQVFVNGPIYIETRIDAQSGEQRHSEIGETNAHRVLYVVWTPRQNLIRVVTAWAVGRNAANAYTRRKKEKNDAHEDDQKTN